MTPTILLTGKNGQVGEELLRVLPRLAIVTALGRQELDLSRSEDIRQIIRDVRPNLIVNAAAYTAVDQAEEDESAARAINAHAPAVLAEEAKRIGATLVHYSTDYVFDGSKKSPYEENDATNPLNVYGRTKLEGEQAIRNAGVPHLIFRTSWVYATRGKNFLLTILRLATQREELRIVQDQTGAPTSGREIAAATTAILAQLLQENSGSSFQGRTGTYHMTASGETTWYDFAGAVLKKSSDTPQTASWFAVATNGRPLITRRVVPITTEEFPTPARRPLYSVLSNSLLAKTFGVALPNWREQMNATFASV
jgi:dTDP-4-dehydrorhamnose reductase